LHDGWDRGGCGQRDGATAIKGIRRGTVAFSGKVEIDVCLPGQDGPFVTLEVVRAHVRMHMAPVVAGDGGVVTAFVWGIAMMIHEATI